MLRGREAALAFAAGGLASMAFWHFHAWVVARMLTPALRKRWFYGLLGLAKLALIVLVLRGIMAGLPREALPLATGILLFVLAILLEALMLVFRPDAGDAP
jgi:hypothetical protein